jgi:transcriptional regulator with XRE-family HTH domain
MSTAESWHLDLHAQRAGFNSFADLLKAEAHGDDRHVAGLKKAGFDSIEALAATANEEVRQQAVSSPTWRDLEQALTALGSEENIARRIKLLRQRVGMSQEQLAKRLEALGVQMPQSSISKIEVPVEEGRGKRRDITVDEALALAKALDVTFSDLVLPLNVIADLQLHRMLADGSRLWQARHGAQLDYEYVVGQLTEAASMRPAWHQRLEEELERLKRMETGVDEQGRRQPDAPPLTPSDMALKLFLEDVIQRVNEGQPDTQVGRA